MKYFEPKEYQREVLNSTRIYFDACHSEGNAATALVKRLMIFGNEV